MARYPSSFIWIVKYIAHYYRTNTRYELDQKLLNKGYAAEEIEQAWQALQTGKYKILLDENPKSSKKLLKSWRFRLGCLFPIFSLFWLLAFNYLVNLPIFITPLPAYPGAVHLSSNPQYKTGFLQCSGEYSIQKSDFEAYATTDSPATVQAFYEGIAQNRGLAFNCEFKPKYTYMNTLTTGNLFAKSRPSFRFSEPPAVAVVILTHNDPDEDAIINRYFANAPANSVIVVLIRGTIYNSGD